MVMISRTSGIIFLFETHHLVESLIHAELQCESALYRCKQVQLVVDKTSDYDCINPAQTIVVVGLVVFLRSL